MILKKLLPILLFSIFLFSCKSNENPKPTLSERTGTYEGGGYTVIVSSKGEIQIIQNSLQVGFALFNTTSREEDFNVGTYKVELDNDPEINNIALSKTSTTADVRLTLEQRAGTYTCVDITDTSITADLIINADGTVKILNNPFGSLELKDTSTSFIVTRGGDKYKIDFNNNTLTGIAGAEIGLIYSITKQ